ncbi:hypothetical protein [Bacillus sp. Marseille-Q3570]|uniref:hypothetical protein n=1 Tax=Bacillus sp. Marseille-Q3570 TaxID=2963522 RepID=UPI0021B7DFAB|nr:hypothetical protein [Bacillus sp. Marseille-Q3570]
MNWNESANREKFWRIRRACICKKITLTISGIISDKPDNWAELHIGDVAHQKAMLNLLGGVKQMKFPSINK